MNFNFRYWRRKWINRIALVLCVLSMGFGLFWIASILYTLTIHAIPSIHLAVFSQMTPPPGEKGGLLNAIVGSIMMVGLATLVGTPIGILAGTYLAENGEKNKFSKVTRFINEMLLSAPSVIIGFFAYSLIVARTGHFSGWSGVFALCVILVPVVVSSTENMLKLVPQSLKEAAFALGAPRYKVIGIISYRAALNGILTGVLLAIARISGETAPLLFTALNNQFWNTELSKPVANLPSVIFQFAMSPYEDWQNLAWVGAFLITVSVLLFNIFARIILRKNHA